MLNAVTWLEPLEYDFVDMPFASSLMMELHYDDACLAEKKDSSCFTVEVYNNNILLKLDTCLEANKARGSTSPVCQFDDFFAHLNKRLIKGNLNQKCT